MTVAADDGINVVNMLLARLQPLLHNVALTAAKHALAEAGITQGGTDLGEVDPNKKLEVEWRVWKPVEMKRLTVTLVRGTVRVDRVNIEDHDHIAEAQAVFRSPQAPGPFSAVFRIIDTVTNSTVGPDLPFFGYVKGYAPDAAVTRGTAVDADVAIGVPVADFGNLAVRPFQNSAAPMSIAMGMPVSAVAPSSAFAPVSAAAPSSTTAPVSAVAPSSTTAPVSAVAPSSSTAPVSAVAPSSAIAPVPAAAPISTTASVPAVASTSMPTRSVSVPVASSAIAPSASIPAVASTPSSIPAATPISIPAFASNASSIPAAPTAATSNSILADTSHTGAHPIAPVYADSVVAPENAAPTLGHVTAARGSLASSHSRGTRSVNSEPSSNIWHRTFTTFFSTAVAKVGPWPAIIPERDLVDTIWWYAKDKNIVHEKKSITLDETLSVLSRKPVGIEIPLDKLIRFARDISNIYVMEKP